MLRILRFKRGGLRNSFLISALSLAALGLLSSPANAADPVASEKVGIYFQDASVSPAAASISQVLRTAGYDTTLSQSSLRQLPSWTNSVRCFHVEDFPEAQQIRKLALDAAKPVVTLKALDLSPAFADTKVRRGRIEIWLCDEAHNSALPEAPYERRYLAWALTLTATVTPEASAAGTPEPSATAAAPDWDDQWCVDWPLDRRLVQLNRLTGESYTASEGQTEWKVFEAPAVHGHGAPEGSCGLRIRVYVNGKLNGEWQDLELSHVLTFVPGNSHCLLSAAGEKETYTTLILDITGKVVWETHQSQVADPAVWIGRSADERLWMFTESRLCLLQPDGRTLWEAKEEGAFYGCFFSDGSRYAFLLEDSPTTKDPNHPGMFTWHNREGVIYSQDGSSRGPFVLPFADVKAQKTLLGLTADGALVLRVDRKIYSYRPGGQARLEALLPHYPGRHPDVEDERPGYNFDVGYDYGRNHVFKFATVVPRPQDHPRPMVRFDIETWKADESIDEGAHWQPVDLTSPARSMP